MMSRPYKQLLSGQCVNLQQLSSEKIWLLVSGIQDSGSNEWKVLGHGLGWKLEGGHSVTIGTLQKASHSSENTKSFLG